MKQCVNCGRVVDDNLIFCLDCSSNEFIPIKSNADEAPSSGLFTRQNSLSAYSSQTTNDVNISSNSYQRSPLQSDYNGKKIDKNSGSKNKVLVCASIVILIMIITAVLIIIKPWNNKTPANTVPTTATIYKNLLKSLHNDPIGTITKYTDITEKEIADIDIEKDSFAVVDINNDKKPELLINVTSSKTKCLIVFDIDETKNEAEAINTLPIGVKFLDDGTSLLIEDNSGCTKTFIMKYDNSQNSYDYVFEASQPINSEHSYRYYEKGTAKEWITAVADELQKLINQYIIGKEIIFEYNSITIENIDMLEAEAETKTADLEKKPEKLEYTTEELIMSDIGKCSFEKITFKGPYSGIDKINTTLEIDYNEFKDEISVYESYAEGIGGSILEYFTNTLEIKEVWNDSNYVSILVVYNWYVGGKREEIEYLGKTFDLNTGEQVRLTTVLDGFPAEGIQYVLNKRISTYFIDKDYYENNLRDNAKEVINNSLNEINYYVDENTVYIIFNREEIAPYYAGDFIVDVPKSDFEKYINAADSNPSEFKPNKMTKWQLKEAKDRIIEAGVVQSKDDPEFIKRADAILRKIEKDYDDMTFAYVMTEGDRCLYIVEKIYLNGEGIYLADIEPDRDYASISILYSEGFTIYSHGYTMIEIDEKANDLIKSIYPELSNKELKCEPLEDYILVCTVDNQFGFKVNYNFTTAEITDERIYW